MKQAGPTGCNSHTCFSTTRSLLMCSVSVRAARTHAPCRCHCAPHATSCSWPWLPRAVHHVSSLYAVVRAEAESHIACSRTSLCSTLPRCYVLCEVVLVAVSALLLQDMAGWRGDDYLGRRFDFATDIQATVRRNAADGAGIKKFGRKSRFEGFT
jgi:hypothetical protein